MRCAIYGRVSTLDQEPENRLAELRRYNAARGWTAVEYIDCGVSGAKDRRPAIDRLVADANVVGSMYWSSGAWTGSDGT
jgi:DNA invertase Pin-like site-specific DNA recombinase